MAFSGLDTLGDERFAMREGWGGATTVADVTSLHFQPTLEGCSVLETFHSCTPYIRTPEELLRTQSLREKLRIHLVSGFPLLFLPIAYSTRILGNSECGLDPCCTGPAYKIDNICSV
jgi:hypothetical protein